MYHLQLGFDSAETMKYRSCFSVRRQPHFTVREARTDGRDARRPRFIVQQTATLFCLLYFLSCHQHFGLFTLSDHYEESLKFQIMITFSFIDINNPDNLVPRPLSYAQPFITLLMQINITCLLRVLVQCDRLLLNIHSCITNNLQLIGKRCYLACC